MAIYVTENQLKPVVQEVDELLEEVEEGGGAVDPSDSIFVIDLEGASISTNAEKPTKIENMDVDEVCQAISNGKIIMFKNVGENNLCGY